MMKTKISYLAIFIFTLLLSCQKDIQIKTLPYSTQLSIECILTPGQKPQCFVSFSEAFFSDNSTPSDLFVHGAVVTINGVTNDALVEDSTYDKFRCRWVPFYRGSILPVIGETYTLKVEYNGQTYTATTTISQQQVSITNTSYVSVFHDVYGEHEGVVLDFTDIAGSENFYRYQMNRLIDSSVYGASNLGLIHSQCTFGEFFHVKEFGRSVYYDTGIDGQSMQFVIEPAFKHKTGDTAYVMIQSLDAKSAAFFKNIDQQKLSQLNPFVEPVFLQTQIPGCIGVFGSSVVSDSVLFVYPE